MRDRIRGYSVLGCGSMLLGLCRDEEGRLETTRWLTLFYLPVLPLWRWRVEYCGMAGGEYQDDETPLFTPLSRLPLDLEGTSRTLLAGWLLGAVAVGPAVTAALLVNPPVPTWLMVCVLATAFWPVALRFWIMHRQRAFLHRPPNGP